MYVAVTGGPLTADYCARFTASYHEFPPGTNHDTVVCCNGGPLPTEIALMFAGMNAIMFPRANDPGWDISAYMDAARGPCKDYDMMLCCGESAYFHRRGWLKRFEEAWTKFGAGMYGSLSSNLVRAHLNTTGFCCPPSALTQYPKPVRNRVERYEFEHGEQSLWRRTSKRGDAGQARHLGWGMASIRMAVSAQHSVAGRPEQLPDLVPAYRQIQQRRRPDKDQVGPRC